MLRVTPVYGCEKSSSSSSSSSSSESGVSSPPLCTLVEYGGVNVLVNMGWNEHYIGREDEIRQAVLGLPVKIDVILITDSSMSSLGGLCVVYNEKKHNNDDDGTTEEAEIPTILATYPTVKMGQMTCYDFHANMCQDGKFDSFTLERMDQIFNTSSSSSRLVTLKYAQSYFLNHKKVKLTPHRAGHVVGASYFIMETSDETQVVMAPTYHHAKERHLDNTTLFQYATACDVFLTTHIPTTLLRTSASSSGRPAAQLVETVLATLRRGGHALLPVDASGRVMELLLILNQYWETHHLRNLYPLVWVGPMVIPTSDFVPCQLEWMASPVGAQFDSQRGNPFALHQVTKRTSFEECQQFLLENDNNNNTDDIIHKNNILPSCILASGASLDHGPARDIFHKILMDDPNHCLILTNAHQSCVPRTTTNTTTNSSSSSNTKENLSTAGQCYKAYMDAKERGEELPDVLTVTGLEVQKVPLSGSALQQFTQREIQRQQQQKQEQQRQAMLQQVELAKQKLLSNIHDVIVEPTTKKQQQQQTQQTQTQTTTKTNATKRFDPDLFLQFSKPCHMMFEVREEAVGVGQSDSVAKYGIGESIGKKGEVVEDDYGISVQPHRFMDIVSGIPPTTANTTNANTTNNDMLKNNPYGYANTTTGAGGTTIPNATDGDVNNDPESLEGEAADLSEGTGIIRGRNGQPPIQVSTKEVSLDILAEIVYIPMEGKVDAMAAKNSIRALQPRQVVYMNSAPPTTESSNRKNVHVPVKNGQPMELQVGHAAYPVRLLDTPLVKSSEQQQLRQQQSQQEITSLLDPYEAKMGDCTVRLLDCVATGKIVKEDKAIVLAPSSSLTNTKKRKKSYLLSDGTVLLTELRSELIARGMKADYSVHPTFTQILVNGRILVQKQNNTPNNDDTIHVEGPLCQDFYTVRQIVSNQYITLS